MAHVPKQTESELSKPVHRKAEEETSLRGTFVSVMTLGTLIILSWLCAFFLFLERQ
jgi:hypothetical protein